MKKAVSILLTIAFLLTCCAIGVSAKGKITDTLQTKIDASDEDEPIRVIIWLNNPVNKEEVFRQAIKECGYIGGLPLNMTAEEMNTYHTVYNRIVFEQEDAAVNSFIEKSGLDKACINETYCLCINADLTKAQIEAAAGYREVESICFDEQSQHATEAPSDSADEPPYLYRERFCEEYINGNPEAENGCWDYRELYYHRDNTGETDWALVYAFLPICGPIELVAVVGNRVETPGCMYTPFETCYGIYDVKEDKFVDAASAAAKNYNGFFKAFDGIGKGRLIGDLDRDDAITVVDATIIQRCEANIRDYPADDVFVTSWGYKEQYYSDFDRDGERGIPDATKIQRYLVDV